MLSDLAGLVTIVGLPLAVLGLWLSRRQQHMSFEQTYIDRFWVIDDALRTDPAKADIHRDRYHRLCEDEFELMRLGFISWRTWDVWHDGITTGAAANIDDFRYLAWCIRSGHHAAHICPAITQLDRGRHGRRRLRDRLSGRGKESEEGAAFTPITPDSRQAATRGGHDG